MDFSSSLITSLNEPNNGIDKENINSENHLSLVDFLSSDTLSAEMVLNTLPMNTLLFMLETLSKNIVFIKTLSSLSLVLNITDISPTVNQDDPLVIDLFSKAREIHVNQKCLQLLHNKFGSLIQSSQHLKMFSIFTDKTGMSYNTVYASSLPVMMKMPFQSLLKLSLDNVCLTLRLKNNFLDNFKCLETLYCNSLILDEYFIISKTLSDLKFKSLFIGNKQLALIDVGKILIAESIVSFGNVCIPHCGDLEKDESFDCFLFRKMYSNQILQHCFSVEMKHLMTHWTALLFSLPRNITSLQCVVSDDMVISFLKAVSKSRLSSLHVTLNSNIFIIIVDYAKQKQCIEDFYFPSSLEKISLVCNAKRKQEKRNNALKLLLSQTGGNKSVPSSGTPVNK